MILNDPEPRASPPAELVVEGVDKWFRTKRAVTHALDNVSFRVAGGEFVSLVGPSGCGKSTLLDIVAGLTNADAGQVLADGQPVQGPGRHRLVLFQESALFPWHNVFGNIMFGLRRKPELSNRERARAEFARNSEFHYRDPVTSTAPSWLISHNRLQRR